MFRGRYEHAVDKKGRTSLPARFRDALAEDEAPARLVLTNGLERCVVAYPEAEWRAFEERLAALPQFDQQVTRLRRYYVSAAVEVEADKMGRVLVPATLRKHAGLERGATWAGMGRHVELWATERFEAEQARLLGDEGQRLAMAKHLAELGL